MILPKWNKDLAEDLQHLIGLFDRINLKINPALLALYPYKTKQSVTLPNGYTFKTQHNQWDDKRSLFLINTNVSYQEPDTYMFRVQEQDGNIKEYSMILGQDFSDTNSNRMLPTQEEYTLFCLEHNIQDAPPLITEKFLVNEMCNVVESLGIPKDIIDSWRM